MCKRGLKGGKIKGEVKFSIPRTFNEAMHPLPRFSSYFEVKPLIIYNTHINIYQMEFFASKW